MIRFASRGDEVERVQRLLRTFEPHLAIDGVFGVKTERAVRRAQRALKVFPPDGIVGPHTQAALGRHAGSQASHSGGAKPMSPAPSAGVPGQAKPLSSPPGPSPTAPKPHAPQPAAAPPPPTPSIDAQVAAARERAARLATDPGAVQPVAQLTTSQQGRSFIYKHETLPHVSNHLYWPKGASGVTIGAGYDMRERSAATIAGDLMAVQVPAAAANKAAQGAGLKNADAETFARTNKSLLDLSDLQQAALLVHILPPYEARVRRSIHIPLHQYEFDALVSFALNSGAEWQHVSQAVNAGKTQDAMQAILRAVLSHGQVLPGLVRRRPLEVKVYCYGEYL